jgi:hypothetical protein
MSEKEVLGVACNIMVQACLGLLKVSGNEDDMRLATSLEVKALEAEVADTGQLTLEQARAVAREIIEGV